MFGYLIPKNYMDAMQFDSENKNSKWYDAIKMEMESMREYKVFKEWDEAIPNKSYNDALIRVTRRTCNNQTETRSEQNMIVPSFSYR